MLIGVPSETVSGETRVAATPETVKKMIAQGHRVVVESGAGAAAAASDASYLSAGAEVGTAGDALRADIVLKVRAPRDSELRLMHPDGVLIGMLDPFDEAGVRRIAQSQVTSFALELAPRTTRAQSMDVLSSQANIAGYKAVMLAAERFQRLFPMLMTPAGTIKAARVVVLGVGVAGLQAIATAKRLGAVVEASDVRPSVREQVESLGAKFIDVPYETPEEKQAAEGVGGYARAMPESWLLRQRTEVAKRVGSADIVITTALIPGRVPPVLVSEDMVQAMRPGSVIVDMAAQQGGNCSLTEAGRTVERHDVVIIGETNLATRVSADSSSLYARNVLEFLKLLVQSGTMASLPSEDEIVTACLMTHQGNVTKR